jgi:hypothetical protein
MPPQQVICGASKRDGSPCPNPARSGKSVCWVHDPELAAKRSEGRKRGGFNRSRPATTLPPDTPDLPLTNPTEVVAALALTFNQVRRGQLGVSVGNCLAIIATAILKAQEGDGLLPRLEALEAAKKRQESRRRVLA